MKRIAVLLGLGLALGVASTGCQTQDSGQQVGGQQGTLSLPLTTQSSSGTVYRLRDANFEIYGNSYQYPYYGGTGATSGSTGMGKGGSPVDDGSGYSHSVVSSETEPDSASLSVSLEQGQYDIYLQPGWRLEKVTNGVAEPVTATLIGSSYQYAYISPHSTSSVSFQFGVGGKSIWLNGQLNVDIQVFETPGQYYGDDLVPPGENLLTDGALETGWIGGYPAPAPENPSGIRGPVYLFGDNITCAPPVQASGCGPEGCCLDYQTIVDTTYRSWGCGIGLDLNGYQDKAGNLLRQPYQGNAKGLAVTFTNSGTAKVRASYTQSDPAPAGEVAPFTTVTEGRMVIPFDQVTCPSWPGVTCVSPTPNPFSLYLQVVGSESKSSGKICITSIEAI